MYFPGDKYLIYSQNPDVFRDRVAYVAANLSRFLFDERHDERHFQKQLDYVRNHLSDRDFEVVHAVGSSTVTHLPGGVTVSEPIWTLGVDKAHYLRALAQSNDRVFIRNPINHMHIARRKGPERVLLRELWEVVRENPDTKFIVFGIYQFQLYFMNGFSGGAISIRRLDGKGIPTRRISSVRDRYGRIQVTNRNKGVPDTVEGVSELPDSEFKELPVYVTAMLMQRIASAVKLYYEEGEVKTFLESSPRELQDKIKSLPDNAFFRSPVSGNSPAGWVWATEGDKRICDTCSLQYACRIYKKGSVCALPNSEGGRLSSYFGTRDTDQVIEGISKILQFQAERLENATRAEETAILAAKAADKPVSFDSEVSKMTNDLIKNAVLYAKLVNPNLTRPQVAIQVNNGKVEALEPPEMTPRLMATAARELEAAGTPRAEQTSSMIYEHISRQQNGGKVIEGEVIGGMKNDF